MFCRAGAWLGDLVFLCPSIQSDSLSANLGNRVLIYRLRSNVYAIDAAGSRGAGFS